MENKYYIPTTEELLEFIISEKYIYGKVVGGGSVSEDAIIKLKFPDQDLAGSLVKFIETCSDILDTQVGYCINPEVYRIKYLDKEDIESLGFEIIEDVIDGFRCIHRDYKNISFVFDFYETPKLIISNKGNRNLVLFIKNKVGLKSFLNKIDRLEDVSKV